MQDALEGHPDLLQHARRGGVLDQAARLDAVEPERVEPAGERGADRLGHVALSPVGAREVVDHLRPRVGRRGVGEAAGADQPVLGLVLDAPGRRRAARVAVQVASDQGAAVIDRAVRRPGDVAGDERVAGEGEEVGGVLRPDAAQAQPRRVEVGQVGEERFGAHAGSWEGTLE